MSPLHSDEERSVCPDRRQLIVFSLEGNVEFQFVGDFNKLVFNITLDPHVGGRKFDVHVDFPFVVPENGVDGFHTTESISPCVINESFMGAVLPIVPVSDGKKGDVLF